MASLSMMLLRGGKSITSPNISSISLGLVGLDTSTLHIGRGSDRSRAASIPWSPRQNTSLFQSIIFLKKKQSITQPSDNQGKKSSSSSCEWLDISSNLSGTCSNPSWVHRLPKLEKIKVLIWRCRHHPPPYLWQRYQPILPPHRHSSLLSTFCHCHHHHRHLNLRSVRPTLQ